MEKSNILKNLYKHDQGVNIDSVTNVYFERSRGSVKVSAYYNKNDVSARLTFYDNTKLSDVIIDIDCALLKSEYLVDKDEFDRLHIAGAGEKNKKILFLFSRGKGINLQIYIDSLTANQMYLLFNELKEDIQINAPDFFG